MNLPWFLLPVVIVILVLIRLTAGGMDRDRIKEYIEQRGGKILDSDWSPFGFGDESDRIYEIRYRDKDGNEHEAYCKTSMWSGVYFSEDQIVKYAKRPVPPAARSESALEAENRRLREELERVRRQQGSA